MQALARRCLGQGGGGHGQGGVQGGVQVGTLGVGLMLQALAAPGVALAGPQHLLKALGLAQRVAAAQQAQQGCRAQAGAAVDVAVLACYHVGQFAAVGGHAPALAHALQQARAAFFMANVARQHVGRGGAFAQVVAQAGKAHGQRCLQLRRHVQHQHGVDAGVHFGVVVGALGHAPQAIQLGQQARQGAARAQHLEHARGLRLHQATRNFLPHALGHEVIDLALAHHLAHELQRGLGHMKVRKTGRKTGHAQDAYGVFAEGVGDVAQHPGAQVGHAAIGVDHRAAATPIGGSGDGVDGEVAPRQVFFQRHVGRGMHHKATVAAAAFALGARQGVFLVRARVQKDGEVAPHRGEALRQQVLRGGAHHHPIAVTHGAAQ